MKQIYWICAIILACWLWGLNLGRIRERPYNNNLTEQQRRGKNER